MLVCVLKLSHEHDKQCVLMKSVCANVSRDLFLLILSIVSPVSVVVAVRDSQFEVCHGVEAVEFTESRL